MSVAYVHVHVHVHTHAVCLVGVVFSMKVQTRLLVKNHKSCAISTTTDCMMHVHDNQARQRYTPRTAFSKEKLPWVGFEPTILRVLGERSTN